MPKLTRFAALAILALLGPLYVTAVSAAPILNVVDGELLGASGVVVGSTIWDVEFVDGTCAAVFNGCDDAASDFQFTNLTAVAAAQALRDQVFLDSPLGMFDSQPELTAGCEGVDRCIATIPYRISYTLGYGWEVSLSSVRNTPSEDRIGNTSYLQLNADFGSISTATWAVFSNPVPIPEPSTALLLGLGLVALGARVNPSDR